MKKQTAINIVIAVVIAGVSFYGGMQYASSNASGQRSARNGGAFGTFSGRTGVTANVAMGEILSIDAQSITLKTRDGSSKIVLFSGTTPIVKTASGTVSDLQSGTNVMVFGTPNSDGSLTAQNIQIRPAGFAPGQFGGQNRPSGQSQ